MHTRISQKPQAENCIILADESPLLTSNLFFDIVARMPKQNIPPKITRQPKSSAKPPAKFKSHAVFIDGEAGTTGLHLKTHLAKHPHITLISLGETDRKNPEARLAAMHESDLVVLCLPDEVALEAVALADKEGVACPLLDASTAHRCADNWVYGFPELTSDNTQREAIAASHRIANTGCYAVGMIALARPLLAAEIMPADAALGFTALSGYSGGGKNLINAMHQKTIPSHFAYALLGSHKHIPEVVRHSGLTHPPMFIPMVGNFYAGMLVHLPLPLVKTDEAVTIYKTLDDHYADSPFVRVYAPNSTASTAHATGALAMDDIVDTNYLDIHIFASRAGVLLTARLDNLGKGAALAAVQNINLRLGLAETIGLPHAAEVEVNANAASP